MAGTFQITRSEFIWTVVMAIILGIFACYAFIYLTGVPKILCPLIEIRPQTQLSINSTYKYMKQNGCGGIFIWHDYTKEEDYLVCDKQSCINGSYCKTDFVRID